MSDQDILNLMYDYADGFTSHILFNEENLLKFARALRGELPSAPVLGSFYADPAVEKFLGASY